MAQVKLKDEGERILFGGRVAEINSQTLTWDRYQWVLANHPLLADKFEVIEEVKESKPSKKAE